MKKNRDNRKKLFNKMKILFNSTYKIQILQQMNSRVNKYLKMNLMIITIIIIIIIITKIIIIIIELKKKNKKTNQE